MSIRYVLDIQPTDEAFKELQKHITELYTEYAAGDKKTYADGSGYAKFEKGENVITAERDMESKVISVTSDESLEELINIYKLKTKNVQKQDAQAFFKSLPMGAGHFFFSTSRRIKFIFAPLLIFGLIFVRFASDYGINDIGDFIYLPLEIIEIYGFLAAALGWIWLVPAGFICAGIARTKTKTAFACKAAAMSLPAVTAAYFISHNIDSADEITEVIGDVISYTAFSVFYSPEVILEILAGLYLLFLPYMIIDEIVCTVRKNTSGSRPVLWRSAIGWACSIVFAGVLIFGCGQIESYDMTALEEENHYARIELNAAKEELAYSKYYDDMKVVGAYAYEHDLYDWHECPDESLEDQWRRLFEETDCTVSKGYLEDTVEFYINGVSVYIDIIDDNTGYGGEYDEYYI